MRHLKPLERPGVPAEQIGPRSNHRHQRHHHCLADWIDRGVRNLREILFEVVEQQARSARQHRDRRVGPHRSERVRSARHRPQDQLEILFGVTEQPQALDKVADRAFGGRNRRQVFQLDLGFAQPLAIRHCVRQSALDFEVVDDPTGLKVDQKHPSRLKPPFANDLTFRHFEYATFRGEDHPFVSDRHARRTEPIAVEHRPDLPPVAECDRRRPVPWLHQRRMIFVKGAPRRVHLGIASPRFGHQHHHRMRQRVSPRDKQFEGIVEACRIRLAMRDQRPHLDEVSPE